MGIYYVNAVMNGLKGREIKTPKWKLKASDIAILVAIANNQPNPGSYHGDLDPICFFNSKTLADYSHLSRSKIAAARDALVKAGLITFSQHERHNTGDELRGEGLYTNVYRINLKRIREYFPKVSEWRNVLRIGRNCSLTAAELHALCADVDIKPDVPNGNKGVPNGDDAVPKRNTNKDKTENLNTKENNNTSQPDFPVAYLEKLVEKISEKLMVAQKRIGIKTLREFTRGKFCDSIVRLVENPPDFIMNADDKIAAMLAAIRDLPPKDEDPNYRRICRLSQPGAVVNAASDGVKAIVNLIKDQLSITDDRYLDHFPPVLKHMLELDGGKAFAVKTLNAIDPMPKPNQSDAGRQLEKANLLLDKYMDFVEQRQHGGANSEK